MVASREDDKFMLRLPDGMRERIAEIAKAERRSMNSQIVVILENALAKREAETKTATERA